MATRQISRDSWCEELDSFSRQHEGWIVSVKTQARGGELAVEARNLPLQGVSCASPRSDDIAVSVGDRANHLTHEIHDTAALSLDLTADGAERALIIDSRDGSRTTVEFRSPMRPEDVDGICRQA